VRTRTLLVLAVVCGFVILAAGVVQLLRIAGQEPADAEFFDLGESVEVGDMTVVVESSDRSAGSALVRIRLGGVDDPDGADEFRFVVGGQSVTPSGRGEGACGPTTVAQGRCLLTFEFDDDSGDDGAGLLLYRRGDDVARWRLPAAD